MRQGKKVLALTVAALASAGLAVGTGGAASASFRTPVFGGSTQNCANGIYAGYCGTQVSVTGLSIAVGFGGEIIGTKNPLAEDAEWVWFAIGTNSSNDKYAEFAPDGIASNKVMADIKHHIVLVTATGASNELWTFDSNSEPGYWKNVQTGDVLRATADGGPIVVGSENGSPSEKWTFETP